MVNFQRPHHWEFGAAAMGERGEFIRSFPASEQSEVFQRMVHHMVFLEREGRHPEELPRRRAIRAIPAYSSPKRAMYLIFTQIDGTYWVLKVANCNADESFVVKGLLSRPPLSDEAWATAQTRLDSGIWRDAV